MDPILHWLPVSLVAIPACLFFLRPEFRRGNRPLRAGPIWACAWAALFASGLALGLADGLRVWILVGRVGDSLFPILLLAGAYALADRASPRWLVPLAAVLVSAEFAVSMALPNTAAAAVCSVIEAPLQALAARVVWRGSPRIAPGFAERALSIAFATVAGLEIGDLYLAARFGDGAVVVSWLAVAVGTGFLQILVFAERSRRREKLLRDHRRLLQRVAGPLLAGVSAREALGPIRSSIEQARVFASFGIWLSTSDGSRLEVVDGSVPEAIASCSGNLAAAHPILRRALDAEEPILLDIASDSRVPAEIRALGLRHGFVAPLRAASRSVGVMAGLFEREPDEDLVVLLRDLSDAIGLVLATAALRETLEQRTEQLAEQTSLLHATVTHVPVGIVMTDPELRIALLNRAVSEQVGLDVDSKWIGRSALELFAAVADRLESESRRRLEALVERRSSERSPRIEPMEIRLAEPESRILVLHTEHVCATDGRHLGRVTVSLDVTRERKLVEHMQHADRMETLGTLAGGLAHDFNNQLTAILGNARLLLDKVAPDDPCRGPLLDIERAAEHCGELTHGLLSFARQQPAVREAIDCGTAIREVETLLRPTFGPDVELRTRIDADTPPVAADAAQLRRVLVNLVVNARDAVGDCGIVELWARPAPEREGQPAAVEIGIRDDGAGMDDHTRRHIFDPFFSTKELGRGTGLGLSIVYGIVAAHEGEIEVESALGSGSTFRLRWPAAGDAFARRSATPRQIERVARRATILLAEDEPSVRRVIAQALDRAGLAVLEASDGRAAVALHARHRGAIDVALVDLSMPHLNGLEAIERMRASDPALRCILMSGHAEGEAHSPSRAAVDWLPKPFGPRELIDTVERVLADKSGPNRSS